MGNKSEHVKSSETETESRREKFFRFKEEVYNSEKMPGMEKKLCVSRNGLLYRVQFTNSFAFCPRQGWIQSSSSDLHKSLKFFPNLISQLFIAVDEINYPPCFIVYYEINKTTERLFRRSHSKPSPSRAKWTSNRSRGFVLC